MLKTTLSIFVCAGAATIALALTVFQGGNDKFTLAGDADGDGKVDVRDAQSIERFLANKNLKIPNPANADVNQDTKVDHEDADVIRLFANGESTLAVKALTRFGHATRLQTGDTVVIQVADRFLPLEIKSGTVRIRSSAVNYDSGDQPLIHEPNGYSVYYHWNTGKLKPAKDYEVAVTINKKTKGTKTQKIQLSIHPTITEELVLARKTDVALPYWGIGLHFTRNYCYESGYHIYKGPLGYGWVHEYGVSLTEFSDGSISFFSADGSGKFYRPTGKGTYQSPVGEYSRLFRDPAGTFQLVFTNGSLWRFRTDLKADFFEDSRGKRVNCQYDPKGMLKSLVDGSGQHLDFEYDAQNRIKKAADSTGRSVTYEYDDDGNLHSVKDTAEKTTTYHYDANHRLKQIAFPDGRNQFFAYDDDNRLKRAEADKGAGALEFSYDLNELNFGTRTIADAVGRVRKIKTIGEGFITELQVGKSKPITFQYDADYRRTGITDPAGNIWKIIPDARNKPKEITDPEKNDTKLAFDSRFSFVTSLIDANKMKTTFEYKETGEQTKTIYPDGTKEVNYYSEKDGEYIVERHLRSGQINKYHFDRRGLLTRKALHDGTICTFQRDKRGNLLSASNATGTQTFEYDILSRLKKATYPGKRSFQFEYDERSRRKQMTDPDGRVLDYEYDFAGRLAKISNAKEGTLVEYEYDLAGQRKKRTLSNGTFTDYDYNTEGRITSIVNRKTKGGVISSWKYDHDDVGNRIKKTGLEGAEDYTYDKSSQLLTVSYPDKTTEKFDYDPVGNRIGVTTNGAKVEYAANVLNQYTSVGDSILTYDLNGNLNSVKEAGKQTTYEHDAENRLFRVTLPSRETITYTYDPFGRLASRTDSKGSVLYLWDRNQIVIEEDTNHTTLAKYTWSLRLDEALTMSRSSKTFFYHQDALRSVTEITDGAGNVVEQYRYRSFGEPTKASDVGNPFLFAGAYYDRGSSLFKMRARWYSSIHGRFVEPDPIGNRGGLNLYSYVRNGPINRRDPSGLSPLNLQDIADLAQAILDVLPEIEVAGVGIDLGGLGQLAGLAGQSLGNPGSVSWGDLAGAAQATLGDLGDVVAGVSTILGTLAGGGPIAPSGGSSQSSGGRSESSGPSLTIDIRPLD